MNRCTFASCGNCGRCEDATDSTESPAFMCSWCGTLEELDDTNWPYCSSLCAARAEADSQEDSQ